jgi:hypothetical protein
MTRQGRLTHTEKRRGLNLHKPTHPKRACGILPLINQRRGSQTGSIGPFNGGAKAVACEGGDLHNTRHVGICSRCSRRAVLACEPSDLRLRKALVEAEEFSDGERDALRHLYAPWGLVLRTFRIESHVSRVPVRVQNRGKHCGVDLGTGAGRGLLRRSRLIAIRRCGPSPDPVRRMTVLVG